MNISRIAQAQTVGWPVYRALVGIGLICAVVIVTVFEVTSPIIHANKQQALEHAVFQVLPNARSYTVYRLDDSNTLQKQAPVTAPTVYAAYDANEVLIGFAVPAQGMGYQDTIELLYGYSTHSKSIEGLVILQSRETPGLGGKIESTGFLSNFNQLEIIPAHALELIKNTRKIHTWQIDAITGATISSRAVVSIMNRSLAFWLPLITEQTERLNIEH